MKVVIDRIACEGHARCMQVAPEVFEVRDDDKSYALIEEPGPELMDKVEKAVKLCPRQAITLQ